MLTYQGIKDTVLWFQKAKPEPTPKDLSTQIGVHLEEVAEMLDQLDHENKNVAAHLLIVAAHVEDLANSLKANEGIIIKDRIEFLDSIADQIVTAVGAGEIAGMDVVGALNEVNRSNFSKFDSNGNPILDNNRKIIKSKDYSKPDLTPFV